MSDARRLRVLIASQDGVQLAGLARTVTALGHEVVERDAVDTPIDGVEPDVALVHVDGALADGSSLTTARCAVVALIEDPTGQAGLTVAARRGVYAIVSDGEPTLWPHALELAAGRHAELRDLAHAFDRRSTIECAKGILMERHGLDQDAAFAMLRDQARSTNRKLVRVAASLIESHTLMRERG